MKTFPLLFLIATNIFASYGELLFNGNCITCHSTSELNKSAPTINEIQEAYKNAFPIKEEFISYMSNWILNPNEETSIMYQSIKRYRIMPNLAYDKETIEEIVRYLYELDEMNNK